MGLGCDLLGAEETLDKGIDGSGAIHILDASEEVDKIRIELVLIPFDKVLGRVGYWTIEMVNGECREAGTIESTGFEQRVVTPTSGMLQP